MDGWMYGCNVCANCNKWTAAIHYTSDSKRQAVDKQLTIFAACFNSHVITLLLCKEIGTCNLGYSWSHPTMHTTLVTCTPCKHTQQYTLLFPFLVCFVKPVNELNNFTAMPASCLLACIWVCYSRLEETCKSYVHSSFQVCLWHTTSTLYYDEMKGFQHESTPLILSAFEIKHKNMNIQWATSLW